MLSIDKFQADPRMMGFADPLTTQKKSMPDQKTVQSAVGLSTGMLSVDQTQKILQQEIATKLEARFKDQGIELKGLKTDDFTPDKVAGRILNFIELGVSRAGDDEQRKKMLEQAREGVDEGFKDAKEILESIGVMNGKVKEDIDKTYDLILNGLNRLTYPDTADGEKDKAIKTIENAVTSSSAATESRSTSVEILTRDGDKVTIDLTRDQSQSSSQYFASDGDKSFYGASYSSSSYTNIQYKVNGDIDEGEKAAIDDLLKQLNGVAKDFYQGDIETAFNKAKEIGFDSSELAKFSVDMNHQQTNSTAVSSYQNVQQDSLSDDRQRKGRALGQDNGQGAGRAQSDEQVNNNAFIRDAANFMSQIDQLMKNNAFDFFANANKSMIDLFDASLRLQDEKEARSDADDSPKSPASKTINEMLTALQDPDLNLKKSVET